MKIKLPSIILVGSAKAGTTSLMKLLEDQLEFFVQEDKETKYFSNMPLFKSKDLSSLYQNKRPHSVNEYLDIYAKTSKDIIENSNDYLYYSQESIKNIKKLYGKYNEPEPKIVILVRNPIERAFSLYYHHMRLGAANKNFDKMWTDSKKSLQEGKAWTFDMVGNFLVADSIKEYYESFANVYITSINDLSKKDNMKEFMDFIGIEMTKEIMLSKENTNNYIDYEETLIKKLLFQLSFFYLKLKEKYNLNFKLGVFKHLVKFLPQAKSNNDITKYKASNEMLNLMKDEKNKLDALGYSHLTNDWKL